MSFPILSGKGKQLLMSYYLNAKNVFSQDDVYMTMVVFADDKDNPTRFVILQRANELEQQDIELGMGKTHIQVDDEQRSLYGGIEAIHFENDKLRILLDDEGKSSLKISGDIEVAFAISEDITKRALDTLQRFAKMDQIAFNS